MTLDTYKSTVVDGIFVTVPSAGGKATIELLDDLAALGLDPVRREYEPPDDEECAAFVRFVLTEIVLKGYATHGSQGLFQPTAR